MTGMDLNHLSLLEQLPDELLQEIAILSGNVNLARTNYYNLDR